MYLNWGLCYLSSNLPPIWQQSGRLFCTQMPYSTQSCSTNFSELTSCFSFVIIPANCRTFPRLDDGVDLMEKHFEVFLKSMKTCKMSVSKDADIVDIFQPLDIHLISSSVETQQLQPFIIAQTGLITGCERVRLLYVLPFQLRNNVIWWIDVNHDTEGKKHKRWHKQNGSRQMDSEPGLHLASLYRPTKTHTHMRTHLLFLATINTFPMVIKTFYL